MQSSFGTTCGSCNPIVFERRQRRPSRWGSHPELTAIREAVKQISSEKRANNSFKHASIEFDLIFCHSTSTTTTTAATAVAAAVTATATKTEEPFFISLKLAASPDTFRAAHVAELRR